MATIINVDVPKHIIRPLRLKLEFLFDNLECTRIILVDEKTSLDDLHTMIQACGNWLNYHLYDFKFVYKGKLVQAEPRWQIEHLEDFTPEIKKYDATKITVEQALSSFPSMLYSYDYGDGWKIAVTNMGYHWEQDFKTLPCLEKGQGAWPPDDVGGEGGFEDFLRAWDDKEDSEHESCREWGSSQGFEKFSAAKVNRRLAKWQEFKALDE